MGMRKILFRIVVALVVFAGAVYIWNASWRTAMPAGETRLIAHRGVHQTYSREGLKNDTCTAERILPPTHDFLENTLALHASGIRGRGRRHRTGRTSHHRRPLCRDA
jgi:hypothetical protein